MLNCMILDDEPLAREILINHLSKIAFVADIVQFDNAKDAAEYLAQNQPDMLFLDIEMPEMTGIEFLKSLDNPPVTVFTTAYRNYAYDGFELGVIDFLLKPISFPRFSQAVEKVKDFLSLSEANSDFEREEESLESIFVKSGVQRIKLEFKDVTHIQGLKDYAIIHTNTGKIVIKGSIKAMLNIFPAQKFLKVHKSFIVSISKTIRVEKNKILIGDHQIPVGRNFKEDLEKVLAS